MIEEFKDLGEMTYPEQLRLKETPPIAMAYAGPQIPYTPFRYTPFHAGEEPRAAVEFTPPPVPDFGPEPQLEKGLVRCEACGSLFPPAENSCPVCGEMNPITRRQQKMQAYNMAYQTAKMAAAMPVPMQPSGEPREEIPEELTEAVTETMLCPACGEPVSTAAKFCMCCGSALRQNPEA